MMSCVYNWIKSTEENFSRQAFGDFTPAPAQRLRLLVKKTVRTVYPPGNLNNITLDQGVQCTVYSFLRLVLVKVNNNLLNGPTKTMCSGRPLGPRTYKMTGIFKVELLRLILTKDMGLRRQCNKIS